MMGRVKLSISLGAALVKEIEEIQKKSGYKRSRVIEECIERGIKQTSRLFSPRGRDK